MIGGAGVSGFSALIASDASGLATKLIDAMASLHYDGIDLDIEDGSSVAQIATLAKALRQAKSDILLDYPGGSVEFGSAPDSSAVELSKWVDRYSIQSYFGGSHGLYTGKDYKGDSFESWFPSALGGATDLTPYAIDYGLGELAKAGVPRQKLALGIGAYAACYQIPTTTPAGGADVSGPRMAAGAESSYCWDCGVTGGDGKFPLSDFFAGNGRLSLTSAAEQKRDAVAKEPYLGLAQAVNESHCGTTRYIVYEDEQSIRDKGAFSRENGYGGVIVWTIGQAYLPEGATGGRSRNALTQALKQGFLD